MRKIFLVIGEQCKDVFIYGNCERFSPEAPVPVFNPIEVVDNLGMAGNVVANLNAIIGKYGYKGDEDRFGDSVASILSQARMTKTRYVDKKSNHIFIRVDENDSVSPLDIKGEFIKDAITQSNAIVISDYDKGFLHDDIIEWICEIGKDKMIFLDSKRPLTQEILSSVDFVKLNAGEYLLIYALHSTAGVVPQNTHAHLVSIPTSPLSMPRSIYVKGTTRCLFDCPPFSHLTTTLYR